MSSRVRKGLRVTCLMAATLVVLVLVAACGGPAEQESSNQQGATSGDNRAAASNQSSPEGAGSGGNQRSQAAESERQPSSGSVITGYDACASYSWLAGTGAGGFSYQSGSGSRVDSSKTPPSDLAAEVARFAEDSLEDVLDGDVSAACFIESKTSNDGSVYVALSVPGAPPAGVANAVGEAMKKRGAEVLGSFSSTSPEGTYDIVTLQGIPVETPNDLPLTGGLYFITTQEGVFQAVMVVSYTDIGAQVSPGDSNVPTAPSSAPADLPTLAVTPVSPTGMTGSINDGLKPVLQQALEVDLLVETFFQSSAAGNDTATISYVIDGQLPAGVEPSAAFSKVVEDLGGTVTFAFSSAESSSVLFEGVKAGDFSADGSLVYVPANNQVAVTFTSINNQ